MDTQGEKIFQKGTDVLVASGKNPALRAVITRMAPDGEKDKVEVKWNSEANKKNKQNKKKRKDTSQSELETVEMKHVTRTPFSFFINPKDKIEIVAQAITLTVKKITPLSSYIPDIVVYLKDKRNRRAIRKKKKNKEGEMESLLETNCCKIRFYGALRDMQYNGAAHPSLYYKYHQFYRQEMLLWYVRLLVLVHRKSHLSPFCFFFLVNDCAGTTQSIFGFY